MWGHTWDFAGQASSTEVNPTHNFGQPGEYVVTHTVNGCVSATEMMNVIIEACTPNPNCVPVSGAVYGFSGVTLASDIVQTLR